ncbi:MAG TPA: L-serine ammonia-lyase, iron-sulfur-dependent, subunit alpha [Syntrophomonadaceae bacterium]|nr:L-serine ammonia-lyase, iron-sulfur-dependent, subunit alpha [Syntrophomonadaceae bacterium]
MYQFKHAADLLAICSDRDISLGEAVLLSEEEETGISRENIRARMEGLLADMAGAVRKGLDPGLKSMGGLIGGNAYRLYNMSSEKTVCGPTVIKAVSYALAVTEINASMGKIVAAPTAGASGILPGCILAVQEAKNLAAEAAVQGLFTAAGIGKIIAENATLSGAEGGCQAECGSAAAMAAAAIAEMMGGAPQMSMNAAAMALKGSLGLVCDPVAGLVEVPCSKRNATGTALAMVCADMAISGITSFIPFDEMVEALKRVGHMIPSDLRETARGGCAATPTALAYAQSVKHQ